MLTVTFHGVRGSTPCSGHDTRRYGGHTSCVGLDVAGEDPVVLDLGTGLRAWGDSQALVPRDEPFRATVLLSHLHWDHVQGLPFLGPIHDPDARIEIYGPDQPGLPLAAAFDEFMRPPYFPVGVSGLLADVRFQDLGEADFPLGTAKVRSRPVPHTGVNLGYRVEWGGASVAYVSDHQQPLDGTFSIAEEVLELADGVDLLIHDAQYTMQEWARKPHWGHCTVDYALHVAREAGASRLALFHHDPSHADEQVDGIVREYRPRAEAWGIEAFAAAEGLSVVLEPD